MVRVPNTIGAMDASSVRRFFSPFPMGISLVAIAGEDKLVSIDAVGPGTQWLEAEAGDGHQLRFVGPQRA